MISRILSWVELLKNQQMFCSYVSPSSELRVRRGGGEEDPEPQPLFRNIQQGIDLLPTIQHQRFQMFSSIFYSNLCVFVCVCVYLCLCVFVYKFCDSSIWMFFHPVFLDWFIKLYMCVCVRACACVRVFVCVLSAGKQSARDCSVPPRVCPLTSGQLHGGCHRRSVSNLQIRRPGQSPLFTVAGSVSVFNSWCLSLKLTCHALPWSFIIWICVHSLGFKVCLLF